MLCSCKPGDICGPGKIIDCSSNCIDESDVNNLLGDGTCDDDLNCSEFNYDDGDCEGTNPTTTTTTEEDTTTTTIDGTTTTTSIEETTTTTTTGGGILI